MRAVTKICWLFLDETARRRRTKENIVDEAERPSFPGTRGGLWLSDASGRRSLCHNELLFKKQRFVPGTDTSDLPANPHTEDQFHQKSAWVPCTATLAQARTSTYQHRGGTLGAEILKHCRACRSPLLHLSPSYQLLLLEWLRQRSHSSGCKRPFDGAYATLAINLICCRRPQLSTCRAYPCHNDCRRA